jgi:hypothetical protein
MAQSQDEFNELMGTLIADGEAEVSITLRDCHGYTVDWGLKGTLLSCRVQSSDGPLKGKIIDLHDPTSMQVVREAYDHCLTDSSCEKCPLCFD